MIQQLKASLIFFQRFKDQSPKLKYFKSTFREFSIFSPDFEAQMHIV